VRNEYFGDHMTVAVFLLAGLLLVAAAIFTARLDAATLADVQVSALELEAHAYEVSSDVYGTTQPPSISAD
jgi:ABC-type xylose transport system permease subunit